MKLNGSLENFHPASLLQWFETERASGVLAVEGRPGYRLRFAEGQLVAAAFWAPGASLREGLTRSGALAPQRAAAFAQEAERLGIPFAEILLQELEPDLVARLLNAQAKRVVFRLLEEKTGRFLFGESAMPFPGALKTPLYMAELLLESARREDEEKRVSEWIPPPTVTLRLVDPPSASGERSGVVHALTRGLQQPTTLEDLEASMVQDFHTARLEIAEMIRMGQVEVTEEVPTVSAAPDETALEAQGLLRSAASPAPDDLLFMTQTEIDILSALSTPQSLESLCQALGRSRQDLMPAVEVLAVNSLVASVTAPRPWRMTRSVVAGVTLGIAAVIVLLFTPALKDRFFAPTEPEISAAEGTVVPAPPVADAAVPPVAGSPVTPEPAAPADVESDGMGASEAEAALMKELESAATALAEKRFDDAQAALERAAAYKPGDPRLASLWRQIQTVRQPPPPPPPPRVAKRQALPPPSPPPPPPPPPAPAAPPPPVVAAPPAAPAPGWLVVNAIPYGFVHIDGVDKGSTPLRIELVPGSYKLKIVRAGYRSTAKEVEVVSNAERLETFKLEPDEEEDGP